MKTRIEVLVDGNGIDIIKTKIKRNSEESHCMRLTHEEFDEVIEKVAEVK